MEAWETQFIDDLVAAGEANYALEGDESRRTAMENIAKPIIEAIRNGESFIVKGTASVEDLNSMHNSIVGEIWAVSDSGVLIGDDGSVIEVNAGDLVRYDGESWSVVMHLELSSYVKVDDLASIVGTINATILAHTSDKKNPHGVTASQVGAYTKGEVDAIVAAIDDKVAKALTSVATDESIQGDGTANNPLFIEKIETNYIYDLAE